MIDLLKVFKVATITDVKSIYKGLSELSCNEVRDVEGLKEYIPKKTVDAMIKRAKL